MISAILGAQSANAFTGLPAAVPPPKSMLDPPRQKQKDQARIEPEVETMSTPVAPIASNPEIARVFSNENLSILGHLNPARGLVPGRLDINTRPTTKDQARVAPEAVTTGKRGDLLGPIRVAPQSTQISLGSISRNPFDVQQMSRTGVSSDAELEGADAVDPRIAAVSRGLGPSMGLPLSQLVGLREPTNVRSGRGGPDAISARVDAFTPGQQPAFMGAVLNGTREPGFGLARALARETVPNAPDRHSTASSRTPPTNFTGSGQPAYPIAQRDVTGLEPGRNPVDAATIGRARQDAARLRMQAADLIHNRPQFPGLPTEPAEQATPVERGIDTMLDSWRMAQKAIGRNSPLQKAREAARKSWFIKDTDGGRGSNAMSRTERMAAVLANLETPFWFRWNQQGPF
jgi:hypothetical protein